MPEENPPTAEEVEEQLESAQHEADLLAGLTPEEQQDIREALGSNYPTQEEKPGVFAFFNKILKTDNTSKVGNLGMEELGSIRIYQSASLYAEEMELDLVSDYLKREAEIVLGTSLSKDGFLITQAVTQKREIQTRIGQKGKRSGWFEKKTTQPQATYH